MITKYRSWLFQFLVIVAACTCKAAAQTCDDDSADIKKALATTQNPKVVLRAAAVAGAAIVPVLRTLSKPGQPRGTVPGAAQVALARLGDEKAFDELKTEIKRDLIPPFQNSR